MASKAADIGVRAHTSHQRHAKASAHFCTLASCHGKQGQAAGYGASLMNPINQIIVLTKQPHRPVQAWRRRRAYSPCVLALQQVVATLTTPPSACAAARPPPAHATVDSDACRTQWGGGRGCAAGTVRKEGGPAGGLNIHQCRRDTHMQAWSSSTTKHHVLPSAPADAPAADTGTPAHWRTHKASNRAGRGTARHLQARSILPRSAPFAKPRPPAESPRTAHYSLQYLMIQRCAHTQNRPSSKRANHTRNGRITRSIWAFGAGTWPEQAIITVQHKLIVQNSCCSSQRT